MNRLRPFLTLRNAIVAVVALLIMSAGIFIAPMALRGPQVVQITPADGAQDANPQAEIRIEFDQWVQAGSIATALTLDPPAEFVVRGERNVVFVHPRDGLKYGSGYKLTLDGTVRNPLGRTMDRSLTVAFATVPYVTVANFGPQNGATNIALNTPISVEFAAPVVSAEQVAAAADDPRRTADLPQPLALDPALPGVGRWLSPTRYSFSPEGGLRAAVSYTATLQTNLTPDGKARLEQPVSWNFTTGADLLAGTRPFDGATDVAADSPVEVRLARDVDVNSAGQNFSLTETKSGTPVPGTVEADKDGFFFKPAVPLQRGASYEARLAPGVRAAGGAAINSDALTWKFTVISDLAVDQVVPLADATEVPTLTKQISVRFNHPVVAVTALDPQAAPPLQITPSIQGVGRWLDTSTYVISTTAPLAPATSYRVEIPAGLKDQTGGELRQPFAWSFSTITPQVAETVPANGANFASPRDPIRIIFNQPMDQASLQGAISLSAEDGAAVPGTVTLQGNTASFTPASALERGTRYTLAVNTGARATGGASLSSSYSATFRVAPLPQLVSSEPAAGASSADPNRQIRLVFSTPMDWASVEKNLTIEPKPTRIFTGTNEAEFYLYVDLQAETDYRVTVGAAARDPYGAALGQDAEVTFRTAPLQPSISTVGVYRIGAYNAYVPARVPLQTVNISGISYDLYRIDTQRAIDLVTDEDRWRAFQPEPNTAIKSATLEPDGERNKARIDLLEIGQLEPGLYFLSVRGEGQEERQIMAVSSYALTVKRSQDALFVWAVDLASGKPVANLPLQAAYFTYGNQISNLPRELSAPRELGRTDGDGVLKAAFSTSQPYDSIYLWSEAGVAFTFTTTGWSNGIDPWSFDLPASLDQSPVAGSLSTDRPIYRPGHVAHIRGVLRNDNDGRYSLPQVGQRAILEINDPEGNAVFSTTMALSEFGSFNTSLPIQQGAKLGSYRMAARLEGGKPEHSFYGSFNVAEYRKPVFEIMVTPTRPDVLQGEKLEANVTARYFAGGALANAPLRWRLLAEPLYFSAESAPGYQFEDLDDAYAFYRWFDSERAGGGELVADGEARTDAHGNFSLSLPAELGKDKRSRKLTLDIEVTDVDGQVIASQGAVNLHAGAFYIGLRPDGYVAQAGQPQKVSLLTLDPQGQPVGNRGLEVGIYERQWYSVREQGSDGRFYFTSAYTDTLAQTLPATTDAQGRAEISFTPAKGGSYRIGATGRDDAGRVVKASAFTWAYGGDVFWGLNDTNRVDLIADRTNYKPGDTAKVLVTAPYKDMTALMTIERGQVIEHKLLTIQGTTGVLDVPIKADYAPNVYVSLVLIKPVAAGATGAADAPAVPDLRVGLVNLPVSTEQQELTITATPDKTEAGPRDEVTYTIKTTDFSGKAVPAEVSLALVDKAVLSLADDPNPTLRKAFYEKRPLGVMTAQSLTALVDRVTLKIQPGSKGGGGGAAGEVLVRRDFPDTAYWNPTLVTGADGAASVTVKLPDSLTTWRLTVRGVSKDTQVGQATQDIVATRPLLVRPALPRFLTVGDKLALQAVVQNNTANAIDATVLLTADAKDGETAALKLNGAAQQNINVPANGQTLVRWQADVPTAGQAILRFSVAGGGLEDVVEQTLPIQRFTTPGAVASAGQVLDTTVETLRLPQAPAQGEIDLELTPSLAAGVQSGLTYLDTFPYGCTEQTVSTFLPNAVTYRLFKQMGVEDPALKTALEQNLATGLQRLTVLQRLDGGWGWWSSDESHPYITAYVVQGLNEAVKAGYGVDRIMLDRGIGYLKSSLENRETGSENQVSNFNSRAYILFVLSEAGQPDRGRTVALYDERAKLDIYGRAYLLMTLKTLGDEERARGLVNDLMSSAIMRPTDAHWEEAQLDYWNMSSNTRTTGLALQALVRADPNNVLVPNAVRYLMSLRDGGHWRTTQETATSLMALAEYVAQSGELKGDYSYRAALDDKNLREGTVNRDNLTNPVNVVIALADLKQGADSKLTIQRQATGGQSGQGRLYYTLRMRYYQDAAGVQPLDQGVSVRRDYIAVNTTTLTPTGELVTQAKQGDVVQVRLTLNVPEDMHYFAVEDMLPAGLEPLDTSLKTTSAAAQDPKLQEAIEQGSELRPAWWFFSQTEIHDNRVALFATNLPRGTYTYTYLARATTVGTFQTLPTVASNMYAPEVFGRSAGAQFTVTAP